MGNVKSFNKHTNKYSYLIMPGKLINQSLYEPYIEMYTLWNSIWLETFRELDGINKLYSDDLLRQDAVHTLFCEGKAIGLVTTTQMDISLSAHLNHSYFMNYPEYVMSSLRANNNLVTVVGFLTVHPEWRKNKSEINVAETLMGLSMKYFLSTRSSAMISISRPDRKTNEICNKYGAICIDNKNKVHNVPVEFVVFYKNHVKQNPHAETAKNISDLWLKRNDLSENNFPAPKELDRAA